MNKERVMVFVDLRNVLEHAKYFSKCIKTDIEKLVYETIKGKAIVGVYIFDSTRYENSSEKQHDDLKNLGFHIIIKRGHDKETGKQKEVDMEMGVRIVSRAYMNEYDTAIIISGDRDFLPAVKQVRSLGKRVEVAGFSKSISKKLATGCDNYIILDKLPLFYIDPSEYRYLAATMEKHEDTKSYPKCVSGCGETVFRSSESMSISNNTSK